MANELLDFVIALVRDPDAAARYAADPDGVLADAHLTGVTGADVNNLLPMVADSLSMATPQFGAALPAGPVPADSVLTDGAGVWTSGAATAALDAFTPQHPVLHDPVPALVDEAPAAPEPVFPDVLEAATPAPVIDDDPVHPVDAGWDHIADPVHHTDLPQHPDAGHFDF